MELKTESHETGDQRRGGGGEEGSIGSQSRAETAWPVGGLSSEWFTFPNWSKYCFTSSMVVLTDSPPTKTFFVLVTS